LRKYEYVDWLNECFLYTFVNKLLAVILFDILLLILNFRNLKEDNINGRKLFRHSKETILDLLSTPKDYKEIAIEDFIEFDKNNLAEYRILYTFFGEKWYWFYNVSIAISILIMVFPFIILLNPKISNYWWLLLCIPAITAIFFLVKAYRKKLAPIVKRCNEVLNLKINPNYNIFKDKIVIFKIQNALLNNFVKINYTKLSSEQLTKIIEALKYESSNINYIYQSLAISISFLTIILATFLSSWFRINNDLSNFIDIAIKCGILWMIISFASFYLEKSFIKDFIRNKRNRYRRLIRVLENYNLTLAENK